MATSKARQRLAGRIAAIAGAQRGVISLGQLQELGLSDGAVRSRVAAGSLIRMYEGVFAVGYVSRAPHADLMAAALACGSDAVISHRSAAVLWRLLSGEPAAIDVTAPNRRGRIPSGIASHRDGSLLPVDRTTCKGIPCTTVARTLLDLAGVAPVYEVRRAVAEGEVLGIVDHTELGSLLRRSRGRRGVARLRLLLEEIDPATKRTRSEMERMFLRMCKVEGLPRPEVNSRLEIAVGWLEADFSWPTARLIVEADSRAFHDTPSAFQWDRKREQQLQLAGWRVSHCTWAQIEHEPRSLARIIRGLLALSVDGP